MNHPTLVPLQGYERLSPKEMRRRAAAHYAAMRTRRTVRDFAPDPVPEEVIEDCLRTAGTAPNGANMQPWQFVVVTDPVIKAKIRAGAESEEHEFYHRRAPKEWLDALAPLGTNEHKPFLESAPCLIAILVQGHGVLPDGRTVKHYYAQESAGIATGMLVTAIHLAGLVALTHTPSPMGFLNEILGRPSHERPFLLLVVGYPAPDARVPLIEKKPLERIATFVGPARAADTTE